MNLKFSDNRLIDFSCFIIVFSLIMLLGMEMTMHAERALMSISEPGELLNALIAPVVEESMKFLMLSISIIFGVTFTAVFSLLEAIKYIGYAEQLHSLTPVFFMMRAICITVHFLTLACQIFGFNMYHKYKQGRYLILGYVTAMVIHFEWNLELGKYVLDGVVYLHYIILGT